MEQKLTQINKYLLFIILFLYSCNKTEKPSKASVFCYDIKYINKQLNHNCAEMNADSIVFRSNNGKIIFSEKLYDFGLLESIRCNNAWLSEVNNNINKQQYDIFHKFINQIEDSKNITSFFNDNLSANEGMPTILYELKSIIKGLYSNNKLYDLIIDEKLKFKEIYESKYNQTEYENRLKKYYFKNDFFKHLTFFQNQYSILSAYQHNEKNTLYVMLKNKQEWDYSDIILKYTIYIDNSRIIINKQLVNKFVLLNHASIE